MTLARRITKLEKVTPRAAIRKILHDPAFKRDPNAFMRARRKVDKFYDLNPDLVSDGWRILRVMDRLKRGKCTLEDAAAIVRAKKAKANG